jgi:putative intracellular protease/amidase
MTTSTVIRRHANATVAGKKVLYIVSNPATLMGFPVGFFAEEMTGPFFDLMQAGCTVDIASPRGGKVEFDGFSDPENEATQYPDDLITLGFKHHATFAALMENTPSIADVDMSQYDAVCVAGGGGPLVTFKEDTALHKLIADFYESGKIIGLICHGTCLMLWTTLSDGRLMADGKTWTGYPDSEEQMMDAALGTKVNAYTIETEAKKNPNTTFESAAPLAPFAIRDGQIITGQQQHSTRLFADLLIEALSE